MSQETGASARPATNGLCDLGHGTSPLWASGREGAWFSALISYDPGYPGPGRGSRQEIQEGRDRSEAQHFMRLISFTCGRNHYTNFTDKDTVAQSGSFTFPGSHNC